MANRKPLPNPSKARIIFDLHNPDHDKFVNAKFAEQLAERGELKPAHIPDYPQSYFAPRL